MKSTHKNEIIEKHRQITTFRFRIVFGSADKTTNAEHQFFDSWRRSTTITNFIALRHAKNESEQEGQIRGTHLYCQSVTHDKRDKSEEQISTANRLHTMTLKWNRRNETKQKPKIFISCMSNYTYAYADAYAEVISSVRNSFGPPSGVAYPGDFPNIMPN